MLGGRVCLCLGLLYLHTHTHTHSLFPFVPIHCISSLFNHAFVCQDEILVWESHTSAFCVCVVSSVWLFVWVFVKLRKVRNTTCVCPNVYWYQVVWSIDQSIDWFQFILNKINQILDHLLIDHDWSFANQFIATLWSLAVPSMCGGSFPIGCLSECIDSSYKTNSLNLSPLQFNFGCWVNSINQSVDFFRHPTDNSFLLLFPHCPSSN